MHSALVSFMQVYDDRFQAESGWNSSSILTLLGGSHHKLGSYFTYQPSLTQKKNPTFCPHNAFLYFDESRNKLRLFPCTALNGFLTEKGRVYCAVRAGSLNRN